MSEGSIVLPAVRVPKKLWRHLEEIMKRKMFSGKAELVRQALREYVINYKRSVPEFRISEVALLFEEGRVEDKRRERMLVDWVEKIRAGR